MDGEFGTAWIAVDVIALAKHRMHAADGGLRVINDDITAVGERCDHRNPLGARRRRVDQELAVAHGHRHVAVSEGQRLDAAQRVDPVVAVGGVGVGDRERAVRGREGVAGHAAREHRHVEAVAASDGVVAGAAGDNVVAGAAESVKDVGRAGVGTGGGIIGVSPDDGGVARNGDAAAEQVIRRRVRGGQLLRLDPGAAVPLVDVGRAGVGAGGGIIVPGPDDGGVARNGDAIAEPVARRRVRGGQLGFAPGAAVPPVDVGRAGVGTGAGIIPVGSDDGGVARNSDAIAEAVGRRPVRGGQLGFAPGASVPLVDVGRAGVGAAGIVIQVGPDDGGIARNSDAMAEVVVRRRVRGGQLGFAPGASVPLVDVGRAGVSAGIGIRGGPDDGGVARNADAMAEQVARRPVRGGQLGFAPGAAVPPVDVSRAGDGIIVRGPDDGAVARYGDAMAEVVSRRRVRGGQLGFAPGAAVPPEDVGRAGGISAIVIVYGADDGGVARNGDASAEVVTRRRVQGGQLGFGEGFVADEQIVAGAAVDGVVAAGAGDGVVAGAALDFLDA